MENINNKFIAAFEAFSKTDGIESQEIHKLRTEAIKRFEEKGIPSRKNENWKYDNLSFLSEIDFNLQIERPATKIGSDIVRSKMSTDTDEICVVILNGYYCPELTDLGELNRHVVVSGLEDALKNYGDEIKDMLEKSENSEADGFYELNTAFARGGVYIKVPDGVYPEKPVRLLFINDAREENIMTQPRNLISIGKNAGCRIVESSHTIGENSAFANVLTEIRMADGSKIEYDKVQNDSDKAYYIGGVLVDQADNSTFNSTYVSLGGKFTRNYTNARMDGRGCDTNFNGLYFVGGSDYINNHTLADHLQPNSNSNELFKGILDDSAEGVFRGKVIVRPDAQKTEAYQSNRNILLTEDAKINTKPQLEIYADDVKCSHGATSGNLDKESIFYLRARGIGEKMAQALLLNAFAGEVIEKVNIPGLRDEIKRLVADRLDAEDLYFCDVL